MNPEKKILRIGGASGYWGDTAVGPEQLFAADGLDVVVLDYLAEVTMSILAKAKARDSQAGYAVDFITQVVKPHLRTIAERGVKVITNAGGLNVKACARAVEALAQEAGLTIRVGTVEGDDVLPLIDGLRGKVAELDSGAPLPERVLSANAYLGAFPIARALDAGADIVITGRCVDSALVLGPLIHAFGWKHDDHDRLAAGSLAGHLLECGAQATGGNFTDWEDVTDHWDDTGFPICEVEADGSFVLTKPPGTGGIVSTLTAAEQMVYEIGDPARYILPDVVCDFTQVTMVQEAPDRVRVEGARGLTPTPSLKVCATYSGGYACFGTFVVAGEKAVAKARLQGEAVLKKTARMLAARQLPPFSRTELQIVGAEGLFGADGNPALERTREVVLRLCIQHPTAQGADLFSREFIGAALSMAPGLTLLSPGRPKASPVVKLYSFLLDRRAVGVSVEVAGEAVAFDTAPNAYAALEPLDGSGNPASPSDASTSRQAAVGRLVEVPLRRIAVARSGDKGDKANIGVVARDPVWLPAIRDGLTPSRIAERFAHLARGKVERFDLPGIHAVNFLLHAALGGGGAASINLDPQAKTYAQVLLDLPVAVPAELASRLQS